MVRLPEEVHRLRQGLVPPLHRSIVSDPISCALAQFTDLCYTASGDRSQIPPESLQTYEQLNTEMQRIRRLAPAQYKAQVDDTEKRLNLLFDALNNDDVKAEHAALLRTVAGAIQARSFEQAQATADDLTKQLGTGVLWMVSLSSGVDAMNVILTLDRLDCNG